MDFLISIVVNAVLLFLVGLLVSGIEVKDGKAAVFGAFVLGLANASVGKLLLLLTLPINFLTLGLFTFVINARLNIPSTLSTPLPSFIVCSPTPVCTTDPFVCARTTLPHVSPNTPSPRTSTSTSTST